jgi:hypothetical protein
MSIEIDEFRRDILHAFDDVNVPDPPLINHECDECTELQHSFAGKSWRDISPELIKDHYSELSLFSASAFHAFIAAYLIYSVENFDTDDMVSEFTAYAFLPDKLAVEDEGHGNWWKLKLSYFSGEQFDVLLKYLNFVERSDEYFDRNLMKRGRERLLRLRRESIDRSPRRLTNM